MRAGLRTAPFTNLRGPWQRSPSNARWRGECASWPSHSSIHQLARAVAALDLERALAWRGRAMEPAAAAAAAAAAARNEGLRRQPIDWLLAAHQVLCSREGGAAGGGAGDGAGAQASAGVRLVASMRCSAAGVVAVVYADGGCELFGCEALLQSTAAAAAETAGGGDLSPGLQILGCGLQWLRADVYGDFDAMGPLVAEHARMFGVEGGDAVVAFKRRWLDQVRCTAARAALPRAKCSTRILR